MWLGEVVRAWFILLLHWPVKNQHNRIVFSGGLWVVGDSRLEYDTSVGELYQVGYL